MKLEELLHAENTITYEECQELWEKQETKVHEDTSDELMAEIADHIAERCELSPEDIVLTIGCGDGHLDRFIAPKVKKLYGLDFSSQKITEAQKRNPDVEYMVGSFLDDYSEHYLDKGINKIYSYSVMQYCKPEDVKQFMEMQIKCLDTNKQCRICHLDIPDVDKAFYYYNVRCEDVTKDLIKKEKHSIKYLIGDGSCWHDMSNVESAARELGVQFQAVNGHYWKFRSDVVLSFN